MNYENINPTKWTTDDDKNEQIKTLLHNYNIKVNEELGAYRRDKFAISVGDELPSGIVQMAKVYIAKKRKLKVVIKWPDVTVTKVLLPVSCVTKICHSLKTEHRLISY